MSVQKVLVQKFNYANIKSLQSCKLLVIGKRGTGKSVLLTESLYNLRDHVDIAIAICGTRDSRLMLERYLPEAFVFDGPAIRKIEKLVELAKGLAEFGIVRKFLLILDNCTYRKDIFQYPVFNEIFFRGHKFGVSLIVSVGYIMDLPTVFRPKIDYIFAFKEIIRANQKRLWEYFSGSAFTFSNFQTVFNANTKNYECLVINNQTNKPNEIFCYYKSPLDTPNFKLGKLTYFLLDQKSQEDTCDHGGESEDSNSSTSSESPNELVLP
jgi:hypothetical protein